jgi:predicted nucleic acid-binding Zn ribbon protein
MKVQIKYPEKKCPICGKTFTKTHNRQKYCTKECSKEAKRRQDRIHFSRWYTKNKRRVWANKKGTGYLGPHRHEDPEKEQQAIKTELQRLKLYS